MKIDMLRDMNQSAMQTGKTQTKQPVIARMERGQTSPQLDTVLKLLAPLGKTLAIVPPDTAEAEKV